MIMLKYISILIKNDNNTSKQNLRMQNIKYIQKAIYSNYILNEPEIK